MSIGALKHRSPNSGTRLARHMQRSSYPPPYPDGWYRLASSASLRRGEARYLECLGRALVIWRSEDTDEVFVMEAFCPHLGGNLAQGRVRGDCIECPFHSWQLTGDGQVAHVPYSRTVPTRNTNQSFPVEELYGQIFMYHRGGGARQHAREDVPYPVPRVPEIDEGRFVFRGQHDAGRVPMHMIELIENGADPAHFTCVHGQMTIPWTSIPLPGVELEHTVNMDFDHEGESWRMPVQTETVVKVLGRPVEAIRAAADVTYTGAGSILNLRLVLPGGGAVEIIQTQLPVGPLEQQVDFRWYADPATPRLAVWYAVGTWISQYRNDVRIWQAKIFRDSPTLSRDDGPVMRLRRWYSQFYPENDPAPSSDVR